MRRAVDGDKKKFRGVKFESQLTVEKLDDFQTAESINNDHY